jgi:hypothetical protein
MIISLWQAVGGMANVIIADYRALVSIGWDRGKIATDCRAWRQGGKMSIRNLRHFFAPHSVAVICTPAATVPGIIATLGARGCRAATRA